MRDPHRLVPSRSALPFLLLVAVAATAGAQEIDDPRDAFFARIAQLCGTTFEGTATFPADPGDDFAGKLLAATVTTCTEDRILIPFAVGEDHSRTWIVSRDERGLLLKHDHRHPDGTPDEITMYGGWATPDGTALSQSFAADEETVQLLPEAATNVWTLTLSEDGRRLTYYLERHAQPRFEAILERRALDEAE